MDLLHRLSTALLAEHPRVAAVILEELPPAEIVSTLAEAPPQVAAGVLHMSAPHTAAAILQQLDPGLAAPIVEQLPVDVARALLRRLEETDRAALVEKLTDEHRRWLTAALDSRPGTAGALMDPTVLVLREDRTVEDALKHVQRWPARALYNLYVIDENQQLRGVLNLQELMLARRRDRLGDVMHPAEHRIPADFDVHAILEHPGWRSVYSLPVVDARGVFLGALRYRTLRRLEAETRSVTGDPGAATVKALASLFVSGVGGMIEAVASSVPGGRSATTPAERG